MAESDKTTKFDIVIFGATGFTGQFVVEEVARTIEDQDLTWAIAGRSMKKLQAVLAEASSQTGKQLEDLPILIADVSNAKSLTEMCQQAKVVLNCVGPYRFYGDAVVRACIENGTHHLDISGEPQFLEKVQLMYQNQAKESGSYIIGACGWDSIPAEMGVVFTKDKFEGELNSVESFIALKSGPDGGAIHFATYQSAIHGFANASELPPIRKELFPTRLPKPSHKLPPRGAVFFGKEVNSYCIPFPGSDRSVVNRTQRYNYEVRKERPVQFNPYLRFPSMFATASLIFFGAIFGILAKFSLGRKLLESFPRIFTFGLVSHEGPTRKQIAGTSFSMTFLGSGYSSKIDDIDEQHTDKPNKTITVRVNGPEPGYISTPICLVQSAYVLLKEQDKIPQSGGVYTPGAAFAKTTLVDRLDKHGVNFKVVEA